MSIRRITFAAANFARNHTLTNCQHMSSKSGTGRGRVTKSAVSRRKSADSVAAPPAANADPWVEVLDKASGQVYYWNQATDETTSLGAPRPLAGQSAIVHQQQEQPQSMMSGLGGVVAQGFAFGVGSSIAHSVVGSMFGGSSSSSSGGDGGHSSGGDSGFDI